MRNWLFWAGLGFIVGGIVSLAMNLAVSSSLSFKEDLTGYALGWLAVGAVLLAVGFVKRTKNSP